MNTLQSKMRHIGIVIVSLPLLCFFTACNRGRSTNTLKANLADSIGAFISIDTAHAVPVNRFYGFKPSFASFNKMSGDSAHVLIENFSDSASADFRPVPIVIGPPLIEPRGMVKGGKWLFISDSGHDENHTEPPTIWKLDPETNKLEIFYRGSLLVNSKWLWFVEGNGERQDELLISDFGEETSPHREGGGVGAKVFAIKVNADGSPGATRVLHEGKPFRDPQGITVIGENVIIADTRAGEDRVRHDAPQVHFANGVLFSLPLKGGKPTRILSEEVFVTLVGSCAYYDGDDQYLRIWDIDGGRRDTSKFAWMPHSGFAMLKRAKVVSQKPLKLGPLETVPFIEEFPVKLKIEGLNSNSVVVLKGLDETTLAGGSESLVLRASGPATVIAESPTTKPKITLEATIFENNIPIRGPFRVEIPKDDSNPLNVFRDNKHAGSVVTAERGWVDISVDGIAKTVALFPRQGGISGLVWRGAPLVTPMASQVSPDGKSIYVSDMRAGPGGTGAIWKLPMPSKASISKMYSSGNAWKVRTR